MAELVPRLWGDLTDWIETDLPVRGGHLIRVEDHQTEQEYTVRAELPGVDPERDVHIAVDDDVLNIRAERREEHRAAGRSEFRYGALHRSVRLPGNADQEHIRAGYANGILEITVPLTTTRPAARKIPVRVSA